MKFDGKLLIIGCGSVSQCAIPLILKLINMPPKNITIMDFVDNRHRVKGALDKGVNYTMERIVEENYKELLGKYVGPGDMIIDLAWNIDCNATVEWCRNNKVLYANTSIEEWNPYKDSERNDPTKYTLYTRHMQLREMIKRWGDNNGTTAVVDHGANPGLVSHFTKRALIDIAQKIISENPRDERAVQLESALQEKNFARLAQIEGLKTIHISERDTQITNRPKEVNEFVNTWSIEGFFEEGVAPAELGWGTHEYYVPKGAFFHNGSQVWSSGTERHSVYRTGLPSGRERRPYTGLPSITPIARVTRRSTPSTNSR